MSACHFVHIWSGWAAWVARLAGASGGTPDSECGATLKFEWKKTFSQASEVELHSGRATDQANIFVSPDHEYESMEAYLASELTWRRLFFSGL